MAANRLPAQPGADDPPVNGRFYAVLIRGYNRWSVFIRSNGDQAITTDPGIAESLMVEAKRHIAKHSTDTKLAASGLRLATLGADQL